MREMEGLEVRTKCRVRRGCRSGSGFDRYIDSLEGCLEDSKYSKYSAPSQVQYVQHVQHV